MSEWIERMEAAAKDVFESMLGVPVKLAGGNSGQGLVNLTALVSLTGTPAGVLGVSCEADSAARIAMLMLGSDRPEPEETAKDALGEICNMVAGGIKSRSGAGEDLCRLSVPTVVSGKDYSLRTVQKSDRYSLCLEFEGQPLHLTLDLNRSGNPGDGLARVKFAV